MNDAQENYFDQKIRNKLEGVETTAPFSWAEFEKKPVRKRRFLLFYLRGFLLSDIILLSLLGTLTFTQMKSDVVYKTGADKFSQSSLENINHNDLEKNENTDLKWNSQGVNNDINSPVDLESGAVTQDGSLEVNKSKTVRLHAEKISKKEGSAKKVRLNKMNVTGLPATVGVEIKSVEATVNKAVVQMNNGVRSLKTNNNAISNSTVNAKRSENIPVINNAISMNEQQIPAEQMTHMKKREWIFDPSPTPVVKSGSNKPGAKITEGVSPTFVSVYGIAGVEKITSSSKLSTQDQIAFQNKWISNTGLGLSLGYAISEHWTAHFGMEYSRRKVDFRLFSRLVETELKYSDTLTYYIYYPFQPPQTVLVIKNVYDTIITHDSTEYSSFVTVLSMPVFVKYNYPVGKFTLQPYGGFGWNVRTTTKVTRDLNTESPVFRSDGYLKEKHSYVTVNIGSLISLRCSKNVDVFAGTDFRLAVPMGADEIKGKSFTVNLGLTLHR